MYLGYNEVTKQYLRSLAGGSSSSSSGGSTGGLDQATADGRYLQKTDASTTYETQTDASNTYLSKTDATNTYAPVDASYTRSESDTKYELKGATGGGGGLSASGFTMTGDIDMGNNKILKLARIPLLPNPLRTKSTWIIIFLANTVG